MDDTKKSKNLVKGVVTYAIGDFGSKILTFLIVPLYTYYINTSDMGVYDILTSTISLLSPIITLQISDAAYRWMIHSDGDAAKYIRATMQTLLNNCAVAAAVIFLINYFYPIPFCVYFVMSLVTTRCLNTIKKLLRGLGNQRLFAESGILYTVIFLALNILQIIVLGRGVKSLFVSSVVSDLIVILVIYIREPRVRTNLLVKPDLHLIRRMLAFSAPLVPNLLSWWVINSSDRYIVRFILGVSANGVLSIAGKFPSALDMVVSLFNTAWQDVSIADRDKDVGAYYSRVFRFMYRVLLSLLWGLIPFTKIYILFAMEQSYHGAADIVAFYYLGSVFQGFSAFYGVGYLRSGKTGRAFTTSIYAAAVNVAVHLALIHFMGLQAAALSTFVAFFVMWYIRQRQNVNELHVHLEIREFLLLLVSCIVLSVAVIFMSFAVCIVFTLIGAAAFLIFNRAELKTMKEMLYARMKKH